MKEIIYPDTFEQAISDPQIKAGDRLLLRGGTYTANKKGISGSDEPGKGVFRIQLKGTSTKPVTICPYRNEQVRLNGGVELLAGEAEYIIIKDIEIAPTPTSREMPRAEVDFPQCLYCTAHGCQFIDNNMHDGSQGMALFGTGGALVDGNHIHDIGWMDTVDNNWHGAGIYTHNHPGGQVVIQNNLLHSFGENAVNLWSAGINNVIDYVFTDNVIYNSSFLCASELGLCQNNLISGNQIYNGYLRLGRPNPLNGAVTVTNNRIHAEWVPIAYWWQRAADVTGNIISNEKQVIASYYQNSEPEANHIDSNNYYYGDGKATSAMIYSYSDARSVSWQEWQDRGNDVNSSIAAGYPPTATIAGNKYTAEWTLGEVVRFTVRRGGQVIYQ